MNTVRIVAFIVLVAAGVADGTYYFTSTHLATVTVVPAPAPAPVVETVPRPDTFGDVRTAKQMVFPNESANNKKDRTSVETK